MLYLLYTQTQYKIDQHFPTFLRISTVIIFLSVTSILLSKEINATYFLAANLHTVLTKKIYLSVCVFFCVIYFLHREDGLEGTYLPL